MKTFKCKIWDKKHKLMSDPIELFKTGFPFNIEVRFNGTVEGGNLGLIQLGREDIEVLRDTERLSYDGLEIYEGYLVSANVVEQGSQFYRKVINATVEFDDGEFVARKLKIDKEGAMSIDIVPLKKLSQIEIKGNIYEGENQ